MNMFKDYYSILNLPINATPIEIKTAFKEQALKWHPDKNLGRDTTFEMQDINEAFLILKDMEARLRYDIEYKRFKAFEKQKATEGEPKNEEYHKKEPAFTKANQTKYEYTVSDELLKKWMANAKKQSVEYAKQTLADIAAISTIGIKTFTTILAERIIGGVILLIIISFITKSCH